MVTYDRDEVLSRTNLAELCEQVLGPSRGRGTSASWPCPAPEHGPQTGKTPPLTVFRARYGEERWRCHACGAGGTAIDLVMTTQGIDFKQAIEALARRAGVAELPDGKAPLRPARIERPEPPRRRAASPDLERYVAACEEWLWSPSGKPMLGWLAARGLREPVLRANRVGADPGPRELRRVSGLPRGGPAVVFPVLGDDDKAIYLQARYLRPRNRKYENPASRLVGMSVRLADTRLARPRVDPGVLVVCEGIPDALSAAQAGYRSVAVLGAGLPDEALSAALAERAGTGRLLVAFDGDEAGRVGGERVVALVTKQGLAGRTALLKIPPAWGDLNGWLQGAGDRFDAELSSIISRADDLAANGEPAPLAPTREVSGPTSRAVRVACKSLGTPTFAEASGHEIGMEL